MKAVVNALARICGPNSCGGGKGRKGEEKKATSAKQTKHARALKSLLSQGTSCYGAAWKATAVRGECEEGVGAYSDDAPSPATPEPHTSSRAATGSARSTKSKPTSASRLQASADASADLTFAPPSHRAEMDRAQSCPAQRKADKGSKTAARRSKTWSPSEGSLSKTPDSMRSAAETPVQSRKHSLRSKSPHGHAASPDAPPPRAPRRKSHMASRGGSLVEASVPPLKAVQVVAPMRTLSPDAPRRNTLCTKGTPPQIPLARAPPRRNTVVELGSAPSTHRFHGDALSVREKQMRYTEILGRIADGASRADQSAAVALLQPLLAALQQEGLLRQPPSPVHSEPDSNPCSPSNRGLIRMRQHVRRTQRCSQTASECPMIKSAGYGYQYRPKGLEGYDDEGQNPSQASIDREILSDHMG